ncbi:MAG: M14 family zinc carboxypeptidase, partial [Planctomycetaceae bacterium]
SGLVIADPPVGDWEQLRSGGDGRLVVMLLGNIHSGECDGKEALLMLARELALTSDHPWLKQAVFVLVPNYNADGNDQVSVENRPGQVGPVRGMGRRETSRGFDLNRDFVKLETAEGRALVRLIDRWNPHL